MVIFEKQEVLDCCALFGPQLHAPSGLDGRRIMAALASNESSTGANCAPHYEAAYDFGGDCSHAPEQAALLAKYGRSAACSFGPWQMLLGNFSVSAQDKVVDGTADMDLFAVEFVHHFNSYVIGTKHAKTLTDVGQIWNHGSITKAPSVGVTRYCNDLNTAYFAARG